MPNNKCDENVDHHDHENEVEHLHQHRDKCKTKDATLVLDKIHIDNLDEKNLICNLICNLIFLYLILIEFTHVNVGFNNLFI